jgi:hypothetical protein
LVEQRPDVRAAEANLQEDAHGREDDGKDKADEVHFRLQ